PSTKRGWDRLLPEGFHKILCDGMRGRQAGHGVCGDQSLSAGRVHHFAVKGVDTAVSIHAFRMEERLYPVAELLLTWVFLPPRPVDAPVHGRPPRVVGKAA